MDIFDDPHIESDMELDREMRNHPSFWNGPPRTGPVCPGCGAKMRSGHYLSFPHFRTTGLRTCGSCHRWEAKLNHTEELRRPTT